MKNDNRKKNGELLKYKYGDDYFKEIGSMGGKVSCKKGFATNPKLASIAGYKGGRISKRGGKNGKN